MVWIETSCFQFPDWCSWEENACIWLLALARLDAYHWGYHPEYVSCTNDYSFVKDSALNASEAITNGKNGKF